MVPENQRLGNGSSWIVVAAQDHASQFARAERHHQAATRLHAVGRVSGSE
jgi:hypothetical protein